jgi:hypothetical protein
MSRQSQVIASFTPEATARFFASGDRLELGRPKWTSAETQRAQDEQRDALRAALRVSVREMASALQKHSPTTRDQLLTLGEGALAGDPHQLRLFSAMYLELVAQALMP